MSTWPFPNSPTKVSVRRFLRARAHQGYNGVTQETDLYGVVPVHGYETTLPGDFKTHHESLHETPCGYVDATTERPRF